LVRWSGSPAGPPPGTGHTRGALPSSAEARAPTRPAAPAPTGAPSAQSVRRVRDHTLDQAAERQVQPTSTWVAKREMVCKVDSPLRDPHMVAVHSSTQQTLTSEAARASCPPAIPRPMESAGECPFRRLHRGRRRAGSTIPRCVSRRSHASQPPRSGHAGCDRGPHRGGGRPLSRGIPARMLRPSDPIADAGSDRGMSGAAGRPPAAR
jgi:hypothetical protein